MIFEPWPFLLALGAYLLGSIPTGVLIARRRGVDLRHIGSGNVGASNVGRAMGRHWAVVVLLIDAAKGALPVAAAQALGLNPWAVATVALAAVVGHVFSLFLRGKGGKGVATALGAAIVISPLSALGAFAVYLVVYLPLRLSSLGSMLGALSYCAFLYLFGHGHPAHLLYALLATAIIVARHRDNIKRLLSGTELRA